MLWWTTQIDEQQREELLLLALFGLALAVRLVFVIRAIGTPFVYDDVDYFDAVAQNLLAGKGHIAYNIMGADRKSLMAPLYPAFLAVVYLCFGHHWLAVQLIQVVLGAVTCVLVYLIARYLINRRVGWIAALIAVGYPALILFTREIMTETLFLFFLVIWMWFIVSRDRELLSFRNQALSGIMQGIMTLTRAVTFFLPWFVLLWQWKRFKDARKAAFLSSIMAMILFFALTLTPWTIRNYRVHNAFIPVASEGYEMLWIFKVKLKGLIPPTDYKYLPPSWYELPEAERGQLALRETLRVFKEQPFKFIKNSLIGSFAIFRPFTPTTDYNLSLGILLPLAAMGVFFSVKFGGKISITHLLLFNFWAMAVLTYGHPRFLVPLLPSLFIWAAYAIDSLLKMDKRAFGVVMGLILVVNLLIVIWFPQIQAFVEGPLKTMLLR